MLDVMSAHDSTDTDPSDGPPPQLLDELLHVVPRLVDRTRSQAEFARTLASLLPCMGALAPRRHPDDRPGVPEHERVDVLSVLVDHDPATATPGDHTPTPAVGSAAPPTSPAQVAGPAASTVLEADLPIQDYDSLAASQVVPRLATLDADELRAVQRYEADNRHRQTILNRVSQLLSS